jgi:hypothetical protein
MHVLTNALKPGLCEAALEAWPTEGWREADNPNERKLGHSGPFAAFIGYAFRALAERWRPALHEWTGEHLIPDFTFRGGGCHEIPTGGYLGMHTDFTEHDGMYRRANTLLYLNHWSPSCGGELVIGEERVPPAFNTSVAFLTGPDSWHGHPDPWMGPTPRKSLALYWYADTPGPGHVARGTTFR